MIIYSLSLVWYNDWLMKFWWEMDILNPESFANYYYLCNKLILMVIDIFLSHGRLMLCNLCPERSGFPKVRLRCWEHYEVLCISHHIPCKNPPMYSIHIYTVYIYIYICYSMFSRLCQQPLSFTRQTRQVSDDVRWRCVAPRSAWRLCRSCGAALIMWCRAQWVLMECVIFQILGRRFRLNIDWGIADRIWDGLSQVKHIRHMRAI